MKVIGVIPARFGSTRFPGKPLVLINGKPLITHVIEGARQAKSMSEIIVATDDRRIADIAEKAKARVVMTDSALPSGTDRTWAAIETAGLKNVDVVVNIQGDEPLIEGGPLDSLVAAFVDRPDIEMATLGREIDFSTPEGLLTLNAQTTAKLVVTKDDRALYFSRFPIPFSRSAPVNSPNGEKSAVLQHVGIYGFRPVFLEKFCNTAPSALELFEGLEQLRALHLGAFIHVVRTRHESWGVDTPADVEKIEQMLRFPRSSHETK